MSEITLLEAAKTHKSALEAFVTKIIVENSPILEYLPMKTIVGAALRYHREVSLGTIQFRGVGGSYTPDTGVINPLFEALVIMGGEVTLDNFEVKTMGNLTDLKMAKYRMKARAAGIKFSEEFFEGDVAVDPYGFDGLRKRLTGNQLLTATDGGGTLTLALIDELLDMVVGDNSQKVLFMNATVRRYLTTLIRLQTGAFNIDTTQDAFGRQQKAYDGAVIRVVRREDDGSTILDFDEDDAVAGGGNLDSASMYCVRFGTEFIHGIQNSALPSVKDFGEQEARPAHMGRIEWYPGLVLKHPRSAARLYHINETVPTSA